MMDRMIWLQLRLKFAKMNYFEKGVYIVTARKRERAATLRRAVQKFYEFLGEM